MRLCVSLCLTAALLVGCAEADHHGEEDVALGSHSEGLALGSLANGCSTAGTEGISNQLIAEMLCLSEGRLVPFSHANVELTSPRVHPYLSPAGRDALYRAAGRTSISINSALRTIAEQYVLWRACSVAAAPGNSNHETGRAIDVANYATINSILIDSGFSHPLPSSDPVHYEASGADLRSLSVLAFQRLWNANNSGDRIAEDGIAGPQTLSRLAQAPAEGFSIGRVCSACTASPETCDGDDDDCDGGSDEGVQNACGACGPLPLESCNASDDDCDGRIDEGLTSACGECGSLPPETCNGADDDCDGIVDEGACDDAAVVSLELPARLMLGELALVRVTFVNSGTTVWEPEAVALHRTAIGALFEVEDSFTAPIAPGGTLSFTGTLDASEGESAEIRISMARNGAAFGALVERTIAVVRPPFAARFVDAVIPQALLSGEHSEAIVVVENAGTEAWEPTSVTIGPMGDAMGRPTSIDVRVSPGERTEVTIELDAPLVESERTIRERWHARRAGEVSRWPHDGLDVAIAIERIGEDRPPHLVGSCAIAHGGRAHAAPLAVVALVFVFRRQRARSTKG